MAKETELEFNIKHRALTQQSHDELMQEFDDRIALLQEQAKRIADAEVTYSIGDRLEESGDEYIVARFSVNKVGVINLITGNRWGHPVQVMDDIKITRLEFLAIISEGVFTRTYDYREQHKR